jgi:Got1/Sft2-like family
MGNVCLLVDLSLTLKLNLS